MTEGLAGLLLAVCVVFMLRMVVPERWRMRFDHAWHRSWQRLRRVTPRAWFQRRPRPRGGLSEQEAERLAEEAIRRAREGRQGKGRWDGNVFRLRGDKRPPPDKLH